MHYIICHHFLLALFALDPANTEPEELQEPALAEDANPEKDQGKHRCI
jgi:hypothetical protein